MNSHATLMTELAEKHLPLLEIIGKRTVHYLDIPMHGNVGDLLIMMGTLRFFEKHQIPLARKAMYFNYDPSWIPAGGILILHGGGNFGDIYGPFQAFRERVITARHDCRILIMPQSIHFADPAKQARCSEIFRAHPDLHICVRDHESFQIARSMSDHVYLMPDMAHQLWPMKPKASQTRRKTLCLQRRDDEAAGSITEATALSMDWNDLIGNNWRFFLSQLIERPVTQAHLRLGMGKCFGNWLANWWAWQSMRFIDSANELFSSSERIVSDRLHAHILSCLLSRPNEIYDNSYGKNSRYISTWTQASELVTVHRKTS